MAPNVAPLFPHLTSTGPPPTALTVVEVYRNAFRQRIAEGSLRPLVLPYHLYGMILLVVYLCIPHMKSPVIYAARWPVLAVICWWQWRTLWETSSMSMATSFGAGLTAAWGVVWSWTWLVFMRPQRDAKRVQKRIVEVDRDAVGGGEPSGNGKMPVGEPESDRERESHTNGSAIRRRTQGNGHVKPIEDDDTTQVEEYYWESYPSNLSARISWVNDLVVNFRGPGWNWQIPPLPKLPPNILRSLSEPATPASLSSSSSTGLYRYPTRASLFRSRIPLFIIGYFILDALKTFIVHDPYFIFGPTTYSPPPFLQTLSPLALRLLRVGTSGFAIVVALEMIFFLSPLLFCLLLGPSVLGLRGESWQYPTTWGSFYNILDHGLPGLWGGWWHQTFRFAFAAPTNYLIAQGYLKPRSQVAKLVGLVFAFAISGILHSAGSITQFPPTFPLHAPVFFMLQAIGIFIQTSFCGLLKPQIKQLPKIVRRMGNTIFAVSWMMATGGWLVDDFARGGVWLLEPVPFSLFRALGYGEKGTGWWCWGWLGVEWYEGVAWWDSGLAL